MTQMIHHPMLVYGKDCPALFSLHSRTANVMFSPLTTRNKQTSRWNKKHVHAHGHGHAQCNTYLPHWYLLIHHRSPCNTTTHTDLSYINYAILYKIHLNMHLCIFSSCVMHNYTHSSPVHTHLVHPTSCLHVCTFSRHAHTDMYICIQSTKMQS